MKDDSFLWLAVFWQWVEESRVFYSAFFMALLGRAVWHAKEVQGERRQFFSWKLASDLPIAAGMAFAAAALADTIGLEKSARDLMIGVGGYLGPGGILVLLRWVIRNRKILKEFR